MARKRGGSILPREVLGDVSWSFRDERFADRAAFDAEVRQEQIDIHGQDTWRPDEVALACPRVRIVCDDFEEEGEPEDDPILDFRADDGESFTAGELLFKLHHAIAGRFYLGDHVFFEGLHLQRSPEQGGTPVYDLYLGS